MTKIRQIICTVAGHVDHGKCISGDTIIPQIDGALISAKELFDSNYDKNKAKKIKGDIVQKTNNITLFTNKNESITQTKASHIWKRKKDTLIEIKTAHGDILKTTPEHPYFKFSINGKTKIKAEELKSGDYIAIPKHITTKDKQPLDIIIEKLKESNFICFLNENSKQLFNTIIKNKITKTERNLSIKNLNDGIKKKRIRINDLSKLCDYFKISDKQFIKMIDSIKNSSLKQRAGHTSKTINIPKFHEPEKFGYVLGCLAGDGHLSKTQVLLDNNDEEIRQKYSQYLKEIFNINSFVKQNHTCKTVVNKAGLTFKKFLIEIIGFPETQKSATIQVPLIAQQNKEIFKGFMAGLFDTDGYISSINHSIEITSKSKLLIKQCSILLLNFNIQSTIFTKNKFYYLKISNKEYLNNFLNNIKPRLTRKLIRIIKASKKSQSSRIFDIIPIPKETFKMLNLPTNTNKIIPYYNKYIKTQNITKSFLEKVLNKINKENKTSIKLKNILESKVDYVKVISCNKLKNKEKFVYDFTVPITHNFIAERTILHNTSILDKIRGTSIQEGEAGGITQKISFTTLPKENIQTRAGKILEAFKIPLEIPGLLFIDTPGHAAFTNLRKRGGSLADIAILVIDINDGIKPQTAEVLQILKSNKTPFIIALNKMDNISGWSSKPDLMIHQNIEKQATNVKQNYEEKFYTIIGALHSHGIQAEIYSKISDFTKSVAIVPCSARTGEGIPEIISMITALSQKFLTEKIKVHEQGKGVILEVKKDKTTNFLESILYDGDLKITDEIAIASFENTVRTKIRTMQEALPLNKGFKTTDKVEAAAGIKLQIISKEEILPGMPFRVISEKNTFEEISEEFSEEISEEIRADKTGIVIKADSLGSLEALIVLLRQSQINIVKVGIGPITKRDIYVANSLPEEDKVILGFNVKLSEDTQDIDELKNIKVITDPVVYKLIENLEEWKTEKIKEIERKKLAELPSICKIKILDFVFRNSSPAVFGVKVEGGTLKKDERFINKDDVKIGQIKEIQEDKNNVKEATQGKEVAISMPGVNFERQLTVDENLYTNLSETQFRKFKKHKNLLSGEEKSVLQEIATIKRRLNSTWGI
ncbi:MAG: translation initiation factor IF-2 [Nanoarchaeota archaeon]|nr:translation initiation factor IF-2 [Nanoarchaeota archaeon]